MRLIRLALAAALLSLPLSGTARAEGDYGAYLAARVAGANSDYRQASTWYTRALIADPANAALMEGAILAHLSAGSIDAAVAVARRMQASGKASQAAQLALLADQAQRGDFAAILADLDAGRSIGMLLDGLSRAWAELGQGRMSEATAEFDKLAAIDGVKAFGLYHKALALASVGDFEGADDILSGRAAGELRLTRRGLVARVQILSQLERNDEAVALLDAGFAAEIDPAVGALRARLAAGETLPYTIARNATEGLSETFFTLGLALNGEADDGYTLLYARIAAYLRPDHPEAVLLAAAMLENQGQYDLAVEAYATIPPSQDGFFAAEIGRARALQAGGQTEAALEVLRALTRRHPTLVSVHLALADALRREERWAEAVTSYDAAVALAGPPEADDWSIYYSRGIARERLKDWARAEPDFRQALALNPDQPQVLNYLGYSFIDRNENLDEALAMIERAVAQSPDSGYIVDSLAWGLFRLGRYDEALAPMERASLLEPVDPTVTDHLGDVYWAVDRKMEARFQWRRALSFNPDEEQAARIRKKLEIGLDAVLAEEGAPALQAVADRAAQAAPPVKDAD